MIVFGMRFVSAIIYTLLSSWFPRANTLSKGTENNYYVGKMRLNSVKAIRITYNAMRVA